MRLSIALCLCLSLTATVLGQNFALTDFSNISQLTLNNDAYQNGNVLRLTDAINSQRGSAYWNNPQPVVAGFDTTFTFQIGVGGGGGGDGFGFVLHNDPSGLTAIGRHASAMGYGMFLGSMPGESIENSVVVEFDTYAGSFNGTPDLSGNEVSIHTGGMSDNSQDEQFSIGRANAPVNMSDGLVHTVRIQYVPGTFTITMDGMQFLTASYDFATGGTYILNGMPVGGLSPASGPALFAGFCAGNGGANETHDILSWTWTSIAQDPCFAGTVGATSGGPYDVLSISGVTGGVGRLVTLPINTAFSVDLGSSPVSPAPSNFIIVGRVGTPDLANQFVTPYGTFCFLPSIVGGPAATHFVLADSFNLGLGALVPATPTPYTIPVPAGLPTPIVLTIQGIMDDGFGSFEITNALVVQAL